MTVRRFHLVLGLCASTGLFVGCNASSSTTTAPLPRPTLPPVATSAPAPTQAPPATTTPARAASGVPTSAKSATTKPAAGGSTTSKPGVTTTKAGSVTYANCDEVRRAGKAPLRKGDPGYSKALDRDGDGVACDQKSGDR